ncbi:hypothetical protein RRG08_029073 [Elysia crispata]|uniref:Uncharacterized protein n=1 Tax=Elysia crispata TaxID=231223 RepID=A0AAE1DIT8_9GAST|nr:hypothetical protein RRG08_029073 [Elysia crispata]
MLAQPVRGSNRLVMNLGDDKFIKLSTQAEKMGRIVKWWQVETMAPAAWLVTCYSLHTVKRASAVAKNQTKQCQT